MRMPLIVAAALVGVLVGGGARPAVTPEPAPSTSSLQAHVDELLEHGAVWRALRSTEAAHRRAIREGDWESLIEVGDAYHRIASRTGTPEATSERAHQAYAAALRNARRVGSVDGVLRAAEAFAQLGDADEVELSLHVARDLAGSDPEAIADVKAEAARLSDVLHAPNTESHMQDGPAGGRPCSDDC